jgi:hypothetical protein
MRASCKLRERAETGEREKEARRTAAEDQERRASKGAIVTDEILR